MNRVNKIQAGHQLAGKIYEILSTKLTPPRLRGPLVLRERLFARLDEGLERRVILLSAPAGFGKTTLVRAWMASHAERADLPPVAWVSLDAGDNDPVRFWHYVLTACQTFQADLGQQSLDLLHCSQKPAFETALTLFINELAQLSGKGMLVLEDYHAIHSSRVHETLAFLLDYLPETLHLALVTRGDPPLPLARWRAHHELYELRAADLRFSLEETQAFIQQAIPFPLAPEAIARLDERTEGWVAGLRLLALALQGRQDPREVEQVLATFTGSHQHILEYLVADVLSAQLEPLQTFLLQTSVLSRLTGSLCDAVTGREDSTRVLAQLDQANLFLYPLDGAGQWYRYHALFAEAMQHEARRRLGEEALRALSHRASLWYEEYGLNVEAIEAAFAARQFVRAADLIEPLTIPGNQRFQNEFYTLHRWLGLLPEELLQSRPVLSFAYATILLFTSDRHARATRVLVEKPLQMAEQAWQAEGNRDRLGEVQAFRAMISLWQGDFAQALSAARESLELLSAQEVFWRGSSLINIGLGELFAGRLERARQMFLEGRVLNEAAGNGYGVRASITLCSQVCLAQGELQQAAQLYRQVLASAEADKDFTDQGTVLQGLAALAYEWNDLETAERQAVQALEFGESLNEDELLVNSSLLLARIQHVHGETEQALQHLAALVAQMQKRSHLLREIHACQARLTLASGDLVTARHRASSAAQYSDASVFLHQEQDALLNARLLIAQGETEEALRLLLFWQDEAQARKRTQSMLEILLLQALAYAARKELSQASQALIQALTLARPEGYQRLFLDEGEALRNLLRATFSEIREEPLAGYARALLLAFSQGPATPESLTPPLSADSLLLEPLSSQEKRVLRLLAAGRSNPEIASELVVSVNTIKTQVQSIYHKLNVNNRQAARDTARRLRLL